MKKKTIHIVSIVVCAENRPDDESQKKFVFFSRARTRD